MSDAIRDAECRAFRFMLEAGQLPSPQTQADADALRKMGIRLRGYGLLLDATLPDGWQAIQTEDRHGQLLDPQGRVRAELFYKDGGYDMKGYLRVRRRYTIYCGRPDNSAWCAWDDATGTVMFEDTEAPDKEQYDRAKSWLNQHYPKWEDPSAYWNGGSDAPRRRWKFWRR